MILVVDNYDSFTFNLVQYLAELGAKVVVRRNDQISPDDIPAIQPEGILFSPGPGRPEGAGVTLALVERFRSSIPMLGVCLGHQAMAESFGADIVRAKELMHGRTCRVAHDGKGLFAGVPSPFVATRYHSLTVDPASVPEALEVSATSDDGEIMGLRHRELSFDGIQFHPEAFLTEHGHAILDRFLDRLPFRGGGSTTLAGVYERSPARGTEPDLNRSREVG